MTDKWQKRRIGLECISGEGPASRPKMFGIRGRGAMLAPLVTLLFALLLPQNAWADTVLSPFALRSFHNISGDFVIIGNTSMTCDSTSPAYHFAECVAARASTATSDTATAVGYECSVIGSSNRAAEGCLNDNHFDGKKVTDADLTKTNASSATLNIPTGATVVFAALYWGAESTSETLTDNDNVDLQGPGFSYMTLTADRVDHYHRSGSSGTQRYSALKVLSPASIQSGTYIVANMRMDLPNTDTSIGDNTYAGWALVVVYADSSLPLQNIAIYDGLTCVASPETTPCVRTQTIPVSGFVTPLNGPVTTSLGVVAYEGDRTRFSNIDDSFGIRRSTAGVFTSLTQGSGTIRDGTNFFNSSITDAVGHVPIGGIFSGKNPDYKNQLGFDIAVINVPSGILLNGDTSAEFQASSGDPGNSSSNGDRYYPAVLVFRTNLHTPAVSGNVAKSAVKVLSGGGTCNPDPASAGYVSTCTVLAGDTIRYTVSMTNTGFDTATNVVLTDNIPSNTRYAANSLKVDAASKTDAIDTDSAEFNTLLNQAVFRLGNLVYNASTSIQFDVIVDGIPATTTVVDPVLAGTVISNTASVTFAAQTTGLTFGASSGEARVLVLAPPTITKSFSPNPIVEGGTSTLTIVVSNPSANPSNPNILGVAVTDTYPSGFVNTGTATLVCGPTSSGTLVGGVTNGNTVGMSGGTLAAGESCTLTVPVTGSVPGNYQNDIAIGAVTTTNVGSNTTGASATLSIGKPGLTKSFVTNPICTSATAGASCPTKSTLTFTLINTATTPLTGVTFTDVFPAGLTLTTPFPSPDQCGGVGTLTDAGNGSLNAGDTGIKLAGGLLAAGGQCTFSVEVTSAVAGVYINTTTAISSTQTGAGTSGTATLTVIAPPTLTKSFSPPSIKATDTSVLTIVVSNPNTTTALVDVRFVDNYPTLNTFKNFSAPTISCTGGSIAGTLTGTAVNDIFVGMGQNASVAETGSGATLLPGQSCTLTVTVIPMDATTETFTNTTSVATSDNAGSGNVAAATLNVTALSAPTVTKGFSTVACPIPCSAPVILKGNAATLTLTLSNSNTTAITGVNLTDTYPSTIIGGAVSGNTCGGTVTLGTGDPGKVTLSGGTIPASGSCVITVTGVTATVAGIYANNVPVGDVSTGNAGVNAVSASATLRVLAPPLITKTFTPSTVGAALDDSTLTITITNPSVNAPDSLTAIAVVDVFPPTPSQMRVASPPNFSNGCGGVVNTGNVAGNTSINVTGITLGTNASCTISVTVETAGPGLGNHVNTTNPVIVDDPANPVACDPSDNIPPCSTGGTATATLGVGQPAITKSFSPAFLLASGGTSTLTITLTNPTTSAMTAAAFTDTFPPAMLVASPPNASTTCVGGSFAPTAGASSITFSGGTIPTGVTGCKVIVNVTATQSGTNVIPVGGLIANSGAVSNGTAASAILTAPPPPSVTKSFSPTTIVEGTETTMTITISNATSLLMTDVQFSDFFPADADGDGTPSSTVPIGNLACEPNCLQVVDAIPGGGIDPVSNTCGGTLDMDGDIDPNTTGNQPGVRLGIGTGTGGAVAVGTTCSIQVRVLAQAGALTYQNNTGLVTAVQNVGEEGSLTITGASASALLTVMKPLLVEKFFTPSTVYVGQASLMTVKLTNANSLPVTAVALIDDYNGNSGTTGILVNTLPSASTNCGGGYVLATSGADSFALTGGEVQAGGFCEINVYVVASVSGAYTNTITTGSVTTSNAGSSPPANVAKTLTVIAPPTVAKSFSPNPVSDQSLTSLMTITLTNPNSTIITGVAFSDFYPIGLFNTAVPGAITTCDTTVTGTPSVTAAPNGTSLSLIQGEIPASGSCTVTVTVTAPSVGSYINSTGLVTTGFPIGTAVCLVGNPPIASATPCPATATLNVPIYIHGTVYNDVNHNANQDGTEGGTGLTLWAKLILNSVVVDVQPVNSGTGAYTVSNSAQGNYSIVIDNNNTTTDMTPTLPSPIVWIGTEAPTQQRTSIVVPINQKAVFGQDFGLFNGIKVTGKVFKDNGVGTGGVANSGTQNGTEAGIAGVVVQATSTSVACVSTICDSTVTNATGDYVLYVSASVATATGASVNIVETNLIGYISTGGSPGTTGGTYNRDLPGSVDTTTFTFTTAVIGTTYTGVNFGDVPVNTFVANGAQATLAGAVVFYAHIFTSGTAGTVTFSATDVPSPTLTGWSNVIYRDTNCNGTLDVGEITVLTGAVPLSTTPDVAICIIVKVSVPAGAKANAQNVTTVTATFVYTNAGPALNSTHTLTDLTTVGDPLKLTKAANKTTALPDETITYTLTYTNNSSQPLSNISITDATPAHTKLSVLVTCPGSLPPNLTACTVTTQPAVGGTGEVVWTFTGPLAPGASGTVTYTVVIN